jgi:hypothetical protein
MRFGDYDIDTMYEYGTSTVRVGTAELATIMEHVAARSLETHV